MIEKIVLLLAVVFVVGLSWPFLKRLSFIRVLIWPVWFRMWRDHIYVARSTGKNPGWRSKAFWMLVNLSCFWQVLIAYRFVAFHGGFFGFKIATFGHVDTLNGVSLWEILVARPLPFLWHGNELFFSWVFVGWLVGWNFLSNMCSMAAFKKYDYRAALRLGLASAPWVKVTFAVRKLSPFFYAVKFANGAWFDLDKMYEDREKIAHAGKMEIGGIFVDPKSRAYIFEVGDRLPVALGDGGWTSTVKLKDIPVVRKHVQRMKPLPVKYNAAYDWQYCVGRGFSYHNINLKASSHIGVGGKPGAGKSNFVKGLITVAARQNPDSLFIVIDPAKKCGDYLTATYDPSLLWEQWDRKITLSQHAKQISRLGNILLVDTLEKYKRMIVALDAEGEYRHRMFEAHPTPKNTDYYSFVEPGSGLDIDVNNREFGRVFIVVEELTACKKKFEGSKEYTDCYNMIQNFILTYRYVGFTVVLVSHRMSMNIVGEEVRDMMRMFAFSSEPSEIKFMFHTPSEIPSVSGLGVYMTREMFLKPAMMIGCAPQVQISDMMAGLSWADAHMSPQARAGHRRIISQYLSSADAEAIERAHEGQARYYNNRQMDVGDFIPAIHKNGEGWDGKKKEVKA